MNPITFTEELQDMTSEIEQVFTKIAQAGYKFIDGMQSERDAGEEVTVTELVATPEYDPSKPETSMVKTKLTIKKDGSEEEDFVEFDLIDKAIIVDEYNARNF